MKATKKIVGAACALVAAVALSAGSTFAWFAVNGTVTASGLTISANTDVKYLVIGNTSTKPQSEQISTTFATTTATLNPVAHSALTTSSAMTNSNVWYSDISTKIDESQTNTESDKPSTFLTLTEDTSSGKMYIDSDSDGTADDGEVYVLKQTFYLWWYNDNAGSNASSGQNELSTSNTLYCSYNVTAGENSNDIPGVVDVVFAYKSQKENATAPTTYMCGNVAASYTVKSGASECNDANRDRTYSIGDVTISSYSALVIDVYIYINGEDANVKNTNATKLDNLTLTVAFSTTSADAAKTASGDTHS